MSGMNVDVLM